jgi:hypothetical protein
MFKASLALLVLLGASAHAAEGDLDAVMSLLAQRQHGHVEFIEQHFIAMLSRPVESSGEMRYERPDHLEKRTLQPRPDAMLLDGGVVTVDRGKTHRTFDLRTHPQVQPFIESIRATLAGDKASLEKLFMLSFDGSVNRWSMLLTPRDAAVKRSVKQVRIDGAKDQLLKVEIKQSDGDRSVMTLRPSPNP